MRPLFLRYLFVGALNTAFGYGCFALLFYSGLHYSLALLLATVLGVLFNFKTIGTLVFRSNDNRLILRFVLVYAAVYAINVFGVGTLSTAGITPYWGGALLVLPIAALAFVLLKRFVFAHGQAD